MTGIEGARRVSWGHLLFIAGLAGWVGYFLYDAWAASPSVRNLILILPASVVAFVLIGLVLAGIITEARSGHSDPEEAGETSTERLKSFLLMGLFTIYILTLPLLGFDVGSFVFVALAMLVDGERRLWLVALYAAAFAVVMTLMFGWLLPYPLP